MPQALLFLPLPPSSPPTLVSACSGQVGPGGLSSGRARAGWSSACLRGQLQRQVRVWSGCIRVHTASSWRVHTDSSTHLLVDTHTHAPARGHNGALHCPQGPHHLPALVVHLGRALRSLRSTVASARAALVHVITPGLHHGDRHCLAGGGALPSPLGCCASASAQQHCQGPTRGKCKTALNCSL